MSDSEILNKATLLVDGKAYGGWKSVSVGRSLENLAGSFRIALSERWSGQAAKRPLRPGYSCKVKLGSKTALTGHIDDYFPGYSIRGRHASRRVTISGRCKTADLVDCSAIHKSGQWRGVKLEVIIRDLIAPFGIALKVETDTGNAFTSFNIEEGETVFECCDRAARLRAVLLTSDENGNLIITRASSARASTALMEGVNILSADGFFSWKDRFSKYTVKGQQKGDDFGGSVSAKATVSDGTVDRYRPLIVIAEDHGESVTFSRRASYERNVRRGRSIRPTITVQGWHMENGELWRPNLLVPVKSPEISVDAELLIVKCLYDLSESGGTTAVLTLARPEAFDLIATATPKASNTGDDWSAL